ncbi:MAG TPA: M57 family metalloprotease [Chitinophaga sp.]|uniref:M57 family metalloprotease n=1 Tax=Chitinophaga sp. TaxID=1869181 RepID=UPI002CCDFEEB|nr:M57 family metalloprotease [Chitinophaga sp.]HVI43642.1 M57 family metalloprotease [Chitinophaga sp.]
MKALFRTLQLSALLGLALTACNKSNDTSTPAPLQQDNAAQVMAYIRYLGFPASSIKDNGNAYVVDEDIVFSKNMQVPDITKPRTEQYYTGSLVDSAHVVNIRLKIDTSLNSMKKEIDTAIARWNRIDSCKIRWTVATGSTWDVYIINKKLDADPGYITCGMGSWPSGGKAGDSIWINKADIASNSFEQRQRTITHEMGHNVSFTHTNAGGTPVPGVGGSDSKSLMNGGQCGSGATVFSDKDKKAAKALYPLGKK